MSWYGADIPISKRSMPAIFRETSNGKRYVKDMCTLFGTTNNDGVYRLQYAENSDGRYKIDGQHFIYDGFKIAAYRFDGFQFISLRLEDQMNDPDFKYYLKSRCALKNTVTLQDGDLKEVFEGEPTITKYVDNFQFYGCGVKRVKLYGFTDHYGYPLTKTQNYQVFIYKDTVYMKIWNSLYRRVYTLYKFKTVGEAYSLIDSNNVFFVQSLILRRIDGSDIDDMDYNPLYKRGSNLVDPETSTYATEKKGNIIDGNVFTYDNGGYSISNVAYYPLDKLKLNDNDRFEVIHTGGKMNYDESVYTPQAARKWKPSRLRRGCVVCTFRKHKDEFNEEIIEGTIQNFVLESLRYYIGEKNDVFMSYSKSEPSLLGKSYVYCIYHDFKHIRAQERLLNLINDNYPYFKQIVAKNKSEWRRLMFATRFDKTKPVSQSIYNELYLLLTQTLRVVEEEQIKVTSDYNYTENDYYA